MEFRWKLIDQRFLFIFIVSRYWMIGRDDVTFFLNNFLNRFFLFCNPFSRFISSRIIFINYGQGRSIARERELDKILYTMRVLRAGKKRKKLRKIDADGGDALEIIYFHNRHNYNLILAGRRKGKIVIQYKLDRNTEKKEEREEEREKKKEKRNEI